jgi:SAM-dependent methyltransferase
MKGQVDYDSVAPDYDRRYRDNSYPGTTRFVLQHVADRGGVDVLEVGCGTGHWLSIMSEAGARVAGLDRSAGMLEKARAHVPQAALALGSAAALPWPDAAFDRVVCINALHHFADKFAFVREAWRVLRPAGRLSIVGLEVQAVRRWCIYDYFEGTRQLDEQRFPAAEQLCQWLSDSGFSNCECREVENLTLRRPAREALDAGQLDQRSTSQLTLLSPEQYQRGIGRIRQAIEAAELRGETLFLEAELSLYATSGIR